MKNYLSSTIKGIVTLGLISVFGLSASAQLSFSAGQDITICQGGSADIISTVTNVPNGETVTYSWISNPGNYQSNIANPTFSNLPVGTYVFTGTATAGVSSVSDQVFVVVFPTPATPTFTIPTNGCPGVAIPISDFTPISGNTYTWHISPNSGATITGENTSSPNITFNNSGNYSIYVTAINSIGCSSTSVSDAITIATIDVFTPEVSYVGTSNYLTGGLYEGVYTFDVCNASGAVQLLIENLTSNNSSNTTYTYSWGAGAPVNNFTSATQTPVLGNNLFTITASYLGCTVSETFNIYIGSNPSVSVGVGNSQDLCPGGSTSAAQITPGSNPSPGTTYNLYFSNNPGVIVQSFTDITAVTTANPYIFTSGSCGYSVQGNPCIPPQQNVFYAYVIATNACSESCANSTAITVDTPPTAAFTINPTTACTNTNVTVTSNATSGTDISGSQSQGFTCTTQAKIKWSISPSTGFTVVNGNLGGNSGNWANWTGSNTLTLNFTVADTYTITQNVQSNAVCGASVLSQTILVGCGGQTFSIQPLGSQTLCQNTQAAPITAVVTGTTDVLSYQWYSNTSNATTGGTVLAGATSSSYSPPTATVGTIYYYCVVTSTVSGITVTSSTSQVVVNPSPTFTTQPAATQSVCVGGTTYQMCVTYANGTGTPAYQWYSNTVNSTSNGTAVSGAMASCFTPPSTTSGTTYYYSIINLSGGGCSSITSNTAEVIVIPDPVLTAQPISSQTICVGGTIPAALSVAYTGGIGTATYQWFSVPVTPISGASSNTYTPPAFTTLGTFGYYATITLAGSGCGSTTSQVATVVVVPDPTISVQPLSTQSLCQTAAPTPLAVTAAGGTGTFLYQWYSNTTNNNISGTLISGATANSYSPPTSTVGTLYYYCVVTTAASGCSVTSAPAAIIVTPAPTFTTQPTASSVCVGGTPAQMCVAYANGTGSPAYQWYSNAINNIAGGMAITGATSSCYTPPSAFAGTTYYYAVINLTGGGCSMINSNIAQVIVDPSLCGGNTAQANFSMDIQGCSPYVVGPVNTSVLDASCNNTTYQWDIAPATPAFAQFVAGTNSSSTNPVIQFTEPGTYTVTLTLNSCGIVTSASQQIVIETTPNISIAAATSCLPYAYAPGVNVAEVSVISNSQVNNLNWSVTPSAGVQIFNGSTTTPTIQFNQSGTYTIQLEGSNICGTNTGQAQVEILGATISYYQDSDSDSFGNTNVEIVDCIQPVGYVLDNTDCDDSNAAINPNAEEIGANGIDENCDGSIDNSISELSSQINLFPNPATTSINLQVNTSLIGEEYVVFDAIGKVIMKDKLTSSLQTINTSELASGNYILKVGMNIIKLQISK